MDKVLSPKVSITLEHRQGFMASYRTNFHYIQPLLKQARCGAMPKVVKPQPLNPHSSAHGLKPVTDMVVPYLRKNEPIDTAWYRRERLYSPDGQWDRSLFSIFCVEKLGDPHFQVNVFPTQAQQLPRPHGRINRQDNHLPHWVLGSLKQPLFFPWQQPPVPTTGQLRAPNEGHRIDQPLHPPFLLGNRE
jgi:hypothetical protein